MRVRNPARRMRVTVQGLTEPDRRERVGVRCGGSAPLRHPCALEFQNNASAWRAEPPYRIPALGAGTKHLFRTPMHFKKSRKNRALKMSFHASSGTRRAGTLTRKEHWPIRRDESGCVVRASGTFKAIQRVRILSIDKVTLGVPEARTTCPLSVLERNGCSAPH